MAVYDISSNMPLRTVQITKDGDTNHQESEEEQEYHVGTFVACMAFDCVWMGVIGERSALLGDYLINVLHPAGFSPEYHWPEKQECRTHAGFPLRIFSAQYNADLTPSWDITNWVKEKRRTF